MTCILLVEPHNVLRETLASALNRQPDFEVGAQTASLAEGRIAVAIGGLDVAVVDPDLPDGDRLELVRELSNARPQSIPMLILTKSFDPAVHDLAQKAGASKVLTTEVSFEEIFWVIRRIVEYRA
jgi:DNA-binding NarL/FixJ family response regulator